MMYVMTPLGVTVLYAPASTPLHRQCIRLFKVYHYETRRGKRDYRMLRR